MYRNGLRLVFAVLASLWPVASASAHQCETRFIFSDNRPSNLPESVVVAKVEVPDLPSRGGSDDQVGAYPTLIDVKLLDGGGKLGGSQRLKIDLRWAECAEWGRTGGPAFVVGVLLEPKGTTPAIAALSLRRAYGRPSHAELDSYIVDPVVKQQADADRRAHDRP